MLKATFFSLILASCVKHNSPAIPNMYDLSKYPGSSYEPTNSVCIDGLLTNLGNSCDTLVEIQGEGVVKLVQCHRSKKKDDPWDKFTFIVHNTHGLESVAGSYLFCTDPQSVVYIKERP